MPEARFTKFPALPVDPRVGISWSASGIDDRLFFLPIIESFYFLEFLTIDAVWWKVPNITRSFSVRLVCVVCKQYLVSRVSCLSRRIRL